MTATKSTPKKAKSSKTSDERSWLHLRVPAKFIEAGLPKMVPDSVPPPLKPIRITPDLVKLVKFKSHAALSQETNAYSAELWFKGRRAAYVSNDGQGGDDRVDIADRGIYNAYKEWADGLPLSSEWERLYSAMDRLDSDEIKALCKDIEEKESPWWRTCFGGEDMLLSNLVSHYLNLKDRSLARQAYCQDEDGSFRTVVFNRAITEAEIPAMEAKFKSKFALVKPVLEAGGFYHYPAPHNFRDNGYHLVMLMDGETIVRPSEVTDTHIRVTVLGPRSEFPQVQSKNGELFHDGSIRFDRDKEKETIKLTPEEAISRLVKATYRYKGQTD